jgi:hypothetical protein
MNVCRDRLRRRRRWPVVEIDLTREPAEGPDRIAGVDAERRGSRAGRRRRTWCRDGPDPLCWMGRRSDLEWAPDDSFILVTGYDADTGEAARQFMIDALTGEFHETPWTTVSSPAVQRVAP